MCKDSVLINEVLLDHHPLFIDNSEFAEYAKDYPDKFRTEKFIEEALEFRGNGYKFVDEELRDYDDDSDVKTGTISDLGVWTHTCELAGVVTTSGGYKKGDIRGVLYNKNNNQVYYMYFPKDVWTKMIDFHCSGFGRLRFQWNERDDKFYDGGKSIEQYRCHTFEELAQKSPEPSKK